MPVRFREEIVLFPQTYGEAFGGVQELRSKRHICHVLPETVPTTAVRFCASVAPCITAVQKSTTIFGRREHKLGALIADGL